MKKIEIIDHESFTGGDNVTIDADDFCTIKVGNKCKISTAAGCNIKVGNDCSIEVGEDCTVEAGDNCFIAICGNTNVHAGNNSRVIVCGNRDCSQSSSIVEVGDSSKITTYTACKKIKAGKNCSIERKEI